MQIRLKKNPQTSPDLATVETGTLQDRSVLSISRSLLIILLIHPSPSNSCVHTHITALGAHFMLSSLLSNATIAGKLATGVFSSL